MKTLFMAALFAFTSLIFSFLLVWGGGLLLPLILLPLTSAFLPKPKKHCADEADQGFVELWKQQALHTILEKETESTPLPVVITHRESTAIVYANSTAREILGECLVGRTVDSEQGLPFKPVIVNGERIDKENHPAVLIKAKGEKADFEVLWATPVGEIPFRFHAEPLLKGVHGVGEFFQMTLFPGGKKRMRPPLTA
ncbi:PAS domain-containing protein [Bdellovibrio sp. HCB337]|uniref:PAS domain-containing protein n=1 Tax=Bdellovibrio sp. HCB337 TaxID=3394358 RepID=UPI0039A40260